MCAFKFVYVSVYVSLVMFKMDDSWYTWSKLPAPLFSLEQYRDGSMEHKLQKVLEKHVAETRIVRNFNINISKYINDRHKLYTAILL